MWTCKTCNRVNEVDDGQCTWCCAYNAEYVSSLESKIDSLKGVRKLSVYAGLRCF